LKRSGINLKEEFALLDESDFLVGLLQNIPSDLGSNICVHKPISVSRLAGL